MRSRGNLNAGAHTARLRKVGYASGGCAAAQHVLDDAGEGLGDPAAVAEPPAPAASASRLVDEVGNGLGNPLARGEPFLRGAARAG